MKNDNTDFYFMELKKLNAEPLSAEVLGDAAALVKAWMPSTKKVVAALRGRTDKKTGWCDYVAVTDEVIYFAILIETKDGLTLRSIKGFKASDIVAFAFMMELDGPLLELRLMLSEGKRIKLCLKDTPENRAALQAVSHSKFFSGK